MGPSDMVIKRHADILRRGHKITNQDEEASLVQYDDDGPTLRYAEQTMADVSAVFCWGESAYSAMMAVYPHYAEKIFLTGSPRADLWTPRFKDYWERSIDCPKGPFLLVSSNMAGAGIGFNSTLSMLSKAGYFARDKNASATLLLEESERYRVWASFVEAITELSQSGKGYKVIVRPHPAENPDVWKILLSGLPNVEVTREGAISGWLHGAFALLHNGCTTALEATLARKPIISYPDFGQKTLRLSNDLGSKATNLNELKDLVQHYLSTGKSGRAHDVSIEDMEIVKSKIRTEESELAASRVVDVWDQLVSKNSIALHTLFAYRLLLLMKFARDHVFSLFFPNGRRDIIHQTKEKFPSFDFPKVKEQVKTLEEMLSCPGRVETVWLGDRTVLIRPRQRFAAA